MNDSDYCIIISDLSSLLVEFLSFGDIIVCSRSCHLGGEQSRGRLARTSANQWICFRLIIPPPPFSHPPRPTTLCVSSRIDRYNNSSSHAHFCRFTSADWSHRLREKGLVLPRGNTIPNHPRQPTASLKLSTPRHDGGLIN